MSRQIICDRCKGVIPARKQEEIPLELTIKDNKRDVVHCETEYCDGCRKTIMGVLFPASLASDVMPEWIRGYTYGIEVCPGAPKPVLLNLRLSPEGKPIIDPDEKNGLFFGNTLAEALNEAFLYLKP